MCIDLVLIFLLTVMAKKVHRVWWNHSKATCWGSSIWSHTFHTKRRVVYKLLHGKMSYHKHYDKICFCFDAWCVWWLMWQYHGGTNFGRTAGGPFITTSYDYDAPIDEYGTMILTLSLCNPQWCVSFFTFNLNWFLFLHNAGLVQEPKYSHLKQLHQAIKQCESALVSSEPKVTKLGNYEEAHVFSAGKGSCVAFLSNYHMNAPAKVVFNNRHYTLPAWSTSILPDCRNVVFNTATVC